MSEIKINRIFKQFRFGPLRGFDEFFGNGSQYAIPLTTSNQILIRFAFNLIYFRTNYILVALIAILSKCILNLDQFLGVIYTLIFVGGLFITSLYIFKFLEKDNEKSTFKIIFIFLATCLFYFYGKAVIFIIIFLLVILIHPLLRMIESKRVNNFVSEEIHGEGVFEKKEFISNLNNSSIEFIEIWNEDSDRLDVKFPIKYLLDFISVFK
ncbi:unnamed protein product [Brachionus calyciflorus]|uniref:PRA1 family protein n=1 Tax=Brachionus calyciflorus TaxID=104777 RepID=A0A813M7N2_9BILA|nr:unnamed protein product [Brachionus calyciflorus]